MSVQTQKTDLLTHNTHTHQFVSEIGGAEEDDIHTQTGMTAMDIQRYFRHRRGKLLQAIFSSNSTVENAPKIVGGICESALLSTWI